MAKKKKLKKINKVVNKKTKKKFKLRLNFDLPEDIKKKIYGIIMFLIAVIVSLSFFHKAGDGGEFLMKSFIYLIGKAVFILPLLFIIGGLVFFFYKKADKKFRKNNSNKLTMLGIILAIIGITGMLETLYSNSFQAKEFGGLVGYLISYPFITIFGVWGAGAVFMAVIIISGIIFYQLAPDGFWKIKIKKEKQEALLPQINGNGKPIKVPEFKIKEIKSDAELREPDKEKEKTGIFQKKRKQEQPDILSDSSKHLSTQKYELPSLELLEKDKGTAYSGDIKRNSAIIKQTFENFNIAVQMEEINVGPTVTQYTLTPSQGVKLSKITALNNDLSLALAAHPIRIEAPIPGRSLVGIELPNTTRAVIGMRTLLETPKFKEFGDGLLLALGKDVSGGPIFADLCKMPHLLVAGSTGSGKTICLNSIILSLLYKNSPKTLRMILVDPKRVEFPVYNSLPHLLSPVIYNAQKTVEALRWLTTEMERRFDVLSGVGARDIKGYNDIIKDKIKKLSNTEAKQEEKDELEIMPYIVLIIDELADVMAMKGREVEAEIVRLSQMSRAVGIHIILATQRPSVEVLTGLIKANIISRITFKVASQIDSRTILDMAGAEKLLGAGDMLFISSEHSKPKRIQGIYISEKEIKKSIDFIKQFQSGDEQELKLDADENNEDETSDSLKKALEFSELNKGFTDEEEDALYEEAKEIAIQAKKASASLFQRRLRIGYARAARLIDTLEERGVIGPGDGARPREILSLQSGFGQENAIALKRENSDNEDVVDDDNQQNNNDGFTKL